MNLKELRKSKQITCEEMASACNVSVHTMRAYESGARQMSADVLCRMAKELGVTMDEVYDAHTRRRKKGGTRE